VVANVDGTKVSWTVTVDANGDPATVRVRSGERDQTFSANSVDVSTFTTSTIDIGYSTTENVTVTITDSNPNRGTGTRTGTVTTEDPPPPQVSVSRGSKCNDNGGTPCYRGGDGTLCLHASCGFIVITTSDFTSGSTTCRIYDDANGHFATKTVSTNRSEQTTSYFGYPARSIWADCADAAASPRYNWPND
jgi:hypothetical protein